MSGDKLTEADVRAVYIDPALQKAGWKVNMISREYYFTDGRVIVEGDTARRDKRMFADYLLSYKPNLPLAIIEAKDMTHTPDAGIQQAGEYAKILDVPFYYSTNGESFIEHDTLTGIECELAMDDFPSPMELWRRYKDVREITPERESVITQPYHFDVGDYEPRYYQRIAINRAVDAVANGQKRILIVMATGTGKTYTAFQIVHRLRMSGAKKKILFLVDRNFLADQTMKTFKPFSKVMTKVQGRKLDSAYEVYMSLYQQLAGEDGSEPFRTFAPEFFDLIIVDECHRGSAAEDSLWRKILEYFSSATQIGMTATPKETKDTSNISYFGDPIYTYSLKQGLADGFLAPYKVYRSIFDLDAMNWRPFDGQRDRYGELIEDREYNLSDTDRNIVYSERDKAVAKYISDFLKRTNRFDKTIVFCVDIDHAGRMRRALINENADLVAQDSRYVMKITGDDDEGKAQLENFMDVNEQYPVIVTTSQLMTTGADCKTCKLIVLDKKVESMTEFKQIIGRGTRLSEKHGKMYFTIIDIRGATALFADPDFDGEPVQIFEPDGKAPEPPMPGPDPEPPVPPVYPPEPPDPEKKKHKYVVDGVDVELIGERVQYIGPDGKLTTKSLTDFTRESILGEYATLDSFLAAWNAENRKQAIIDALDEKGFPLIRLREATGRDDLDDFDLLCHVAWDAKPLTKAERANNVKKRGYLHKYSGLARDVLSALLDKYQETGIKDLEDVRHFQNDPLRQLGSIRKIVDAFGGKAEFQRAVYELEAELYKAA